MGAIIEKAVVIQPETDSVIANSVAAAKACMEAAAITAETIGLVINCSVNRDDNIMEPSVASLIQKELAIGLDLNQEAVEQFSFSFDLIDGACGVPKAIQTAIGFLQSGRIQHALIVAGEAHPSKTRRDDFPYAVSAAALLLSWSDDDRGFMGFKALSETEGEDAGFTIRGKLADFGTEGRGFIVCDSSDDMDARCAQLTQACASELLKSQQLAHCDFLIGTDRSTGYIQQLADGIASEAVTLYDTFGGDIHSAAPIAAFARIEASLKAGQTVLMACAGSGVSSACSLYRA